MTTMNTTREQQLMEDFEWKLREMEKDHKKKMEERDRKAEVSTEGVDFFFLSVYNAGSLFWIWMNLNCC